MKILRSKSKVSTVALVLVLTITATLAALPKVNAIDVPTYAFITVAPNPVGAGQETIVMFWLNLVPPTAEGPHGDRWENLTVEVTKPDESKETLGSFTSDPVGSAWTIFVPDRVGTYTFQMSFPGQHITGVGAIIPIPIDNEYLPSTSAEAELIVQADRIEGWPAAELPTDYWERPIYGENREWYTIGGNWLAGGGNRGSYNASGDSYFGGGFNPYTKAPNTAHIVWTKSLAFGGIMGGSFGGGGTSSYYHGMNYEPKFDPPVIINGVLYYNTPSQPVYGFHAVDLRTGKELWWHNGTGQLTTSAFGTTKVYPGITLGQIYNYISPNQYGGIPYLWYTGGSTWHMYDAYTGNWILSLENATRSVGSPNIVYSPEGDILLYWLNGQNNWLAMWNSSRVTGMVASPSDIPYGGTAEWMWRPTPGATLDWRTGIQWNVTVPDVAGSQSIARIGSGVILATTGSLLIPSPGWQMEVGYNMKTGEQRWVQNRTTIIGATAFSLMGPVSNGVYTEFEKETMTWSGYDIYTGEQLWGPTEPYTNAFGMYQNGAFIAYGKLYAEGMDGTVHCYNVTTGKHLWDWFTGSSGLETVYGHWPLVSGPAIADGKVYVCNIHSHLQPLYRGAKIYCIDAETGKELWNVTGWMQSPVIADGYLVANNGYDNKLYCFGKGLTETTVTAPETVQPLGTPVLIKGTVTDQSPGDTCLGIPAAGTPAIADEYMSEWMEYLYMQHDCPVDLTGVPVKLEAFGADGSYLEIGTVTSDPYGNFNYEWTPPDENLYTVMATFAGSESYWSSYAATGLSVSPAPEAPPEPEAAPDYTPMFAGIIAAVAVAIIIGIVNLWALRKRS